MHFLNESNTILNTSFVFFGSAAIGIVIAIIIRVFLNNR